MHMSKLWQLSLWTLWSFKSFYNWANLFHIIVCRVFFSVIVLAQRRDSKQPTEMKARWRNIKHPTVILASSPTAPPPPPKKASTVSPDKRDLQHWSIMLMVNLWVTHQALCFHLLKAGQTSTIPMTERGELLDLLEVTTPELSEGGGGVEKEDGGGGGGGGGLIALQGI